MLKPRTHDFVYNCMVKVSRTPGRHFMTTRWTCYLLESVLKSLTGIKREDLGICFVQIIDVM